MSDDLEQLRRNYRAIEAPAALATRLRAHTKERATQRSWQPLAIGSAVAATALFFVFSALQQNNTPATNILTDNTTPKPSMASLSTVMQKLPPVSAPSLSQVHIRSLPAPPSKPIQETSRPSKESSQSSEFEPILIKENDHVHS